MIQETVVVVRVVRACSMICTLQRKIAGCSTPENNTPVVCRETPNICAALYERNNIAADIYMYREATIIMMSTWMGRHIKKTRG